LGLVRALADADYRRAAEVGERIAEQSQDQLLTEQYRVAEEHSQHVTDVGAHL